jgi:alpha-galactosidase
LEKRKLVIIGAGSAMFTQGLIVDFIRRPGRFKWEIALVDVDNSTLCSIMKLCGKMIETSKADIKLTGSVDRCDVLEGSDYVVATVGVGGRRAWEQDVYIPRKYNIYQPVGDTVMVGGISRAMRMVPAMVDIARDINKLCPDAYFFNYSNPMGIICRAIDKAGFKATGLCHGVNQIEAYLANFIGADRSKFRSYGIGINHLTFMYDIRSKGKDAKPDILKKYAEIKARGIDYSNAGALWFDEVHPGLNTIEEPFAFEVMEKYNAFPAAGDRHISEFFAEFFPAGKYYGKKLGVDAYSFERCIDFGDKVYDEMFKNANSDDKLPESYFNEVVGEHEQLVDIIDAIENDITKAFSMNIPNKGAVSNLPYYAALEMPAIVNSRGISRIMVNDFPDIIAGIINRHLSIIEVVVDAAMTGSRELFIESILMGGYITDRDAVCRMVDELIAAQSKYLPQFL